MWHIARMVIGALMGVLMIGCAAVPAGTAAQNPEVAKTGCTEQEQKDCLELRLLNFKWNEKEPLLEGLDRPDENEGERQDRAQFLGRRLWNEGFLTGKLTAAASRSFIVCFWGVSVKNGDLQAYKVNVKADAPFKHVVVKTTFEEVSITRCPIADQSVHKLGIATKALRVRAEGVDPIAVSIQVPKAAFGKDTYVFACTEDHFTVYPNKVTMKQGHWFTPPTIAWYGKRGTTRVLVPYVSKDG